MSLLFTPQRSQYMYKMYFLFIYIILFHSLAVYEVMIYLRQNKTQSNVYIFLISFFFNEKQKVHTASSKKNYSFSFKSLMKILYFFKPVLNVFQKKNCPIIMTISSLCKKCNFIGKGYILEFRAFGSKMKIKKNFTCTYIKRKQISTCTVKI